MLAAIIAAVSLQFTPRDAELARSTASALVERHTPRDAGTAAGRSAAAFIRDAARSVGADARLDEFHAFARDSRGRLVRRRFANVVAEFRYDPKAQWVVLVSHFDTKPGVACPGANDGASTSGLLVAAAGAIARTAPLAVNVMLLWTDGEECATSYSKHDGLWGSRHAADALAADGRRVAAVVCLDMLGDRDLAISIPRNSSRELLGFALAAAARAGLADKVNEVPELVKDDHVPFLLKGFKAIDLIDFQYGSVPGLNDYWHTAADTMDKVSSDSLLAAGRLVFEMLAASPPTQDVQCPQGLQTARPGS